MTGELQRDGAVGGARVQWRRITFVTNSYDEYHRFFWNLPVEPVRALPAHHDTHGFHEPSNDMCIFVSTPTNTTSITLDISLILVLAHVSYILYHMTDQVCVKPKQRKNISLARSQHAGTLELR